MFFFVAGSSRVAVAAVCSVHIPPQIIASFAPALVRSNNFRGCFVKSSPCYFTQTIWYRWGNPDIFPSGHFPLQYTCKVLFLFVRVWCYCYPYHFWREYC